MKPVISFVPGLLNTPQVFQPVVQALPAAIDYELCDCGAIPDVMAIGRELLSSLPNRFVVCGFSLGGYIALAMASLAPERVLGLILINSSAWPDHPKASEFRRLAIDEAASGPGRLEEVALRQFNSACYPGWLDLPGHRDQLLEMTEQYGLGRFVAHQQAAIDRPDQREFMKQFDKPALVISADQDQVVPGKLQAETAALINDCENIVCPDTGHMLPLENPSFVADAIAEWSSIKFS